MEVERIYFFRLRLFDRPQGQLFERKTRKQLLEESFSNKQLAIETHGSRWRFGNFDKINREINYLRVGKVKAETNERFIEGDFGEEILELGVSTKVLVNTNLGLLAIFQNWDLAQNAITIASRIVEILQSNQALSINGYFPVIDQLRDPQDFVEMIKRAYAVRSIEINFKGSNPRDIGLIFHKQLEETVDLLRGNTGQTKISGDFLDKKTVIDIARSTARTGDSVSAKIQETPNSGATWKHMNKSNFLFLEVVKDENIHQIVDKIYKIYEEIESDI
nr:hypothetical protein [uncultured Undibacterium sp.]